MDEYMGENMFGGNPERRSATPNSREYTLKVIDPVQEKLTIENLQIEGSRIVNDVIERFNLPDNLRSSVLVFPFGMLEIHGGRPDIPSLSGEFRPENDEWWNFMVGDLEIGTEGRFLVQINKRSEDGTVVTRLNGSTEAVEAVDIIMDAFLAEEDDDRPEANTDFYV